MPTIQHNNLSFTFPTHALGGDRNNPKLKPADELLLNWLTEQEPGGPVAIYHDRDGVLSTCLYNRERTFLSDNIVHQQAALEHLLNVGHDGRSLPEIGNCLQPLAKGTDLVIMQIPKSTDLFESYLAGATALAGPGRKIAAVFQTRHFTPKLLEIAERYAGSVNQSRAYKKARLILLDDLKPGKIPEELYHQLGYKDRTYYQYYGVFSAKHIDYATQFLLDEWDASHLLRGLPAPTTLLDIGSGCGVIADQLGQRYPEAKVLASDVSQGAIASTVQNNGHITVHRSANLSFAAPQSLDLVVTNPPFHDGHRNSIEPTLALFREAKEKMSEKGHLVLVANRHLNYGIHLDRLFEEVIEVAENEKFVVYRCALSEAPAA